MLNPRDLFHKISYLQYPMMLIGMFYSFKPYIVGFDTIWENYNYAFIFIGLGISFSTLQDTSKTQNKLSRKIWQNPKKGKFALLFLSFLAFFLLIMGLYGVYSSKNEVLEQLSFGIIVLGIGLLGMLKVAIEMFENHRIDKNNHPV